MNTVFVLTCITLSPAVVETYTQRPSVVAQPSNGETLLQGYLGGAGREKGEGKSGDQKDGNEML